MAARCWRGPASSSVTAGRARPLARRRAVPAAVTSRPTVLDEVTGGALEDRAVVGGQQSPSLSPAPAASVLRGGDLPLSPSSTATASPRNSRNAPWWRGRAARRRAACRPGAPRVRHHLGIGLGPEAVTGPLQSLPELAIVRHDSVVDQREASAAVEMGVRVGHGDPAVGRPARVPDAHAAARQPGDRLADLADALVHRHRLAGGDRDAPRVIAPILEPPQAAQDDARRVPVPAHVAEDPAHRRHPFRRTRREAIRRHREHRAHGSRARADAA
jgi:hypothetical protein